MAAYTVAEAKNSLPKLLDRALAGEEVTITRRGKLIARLVPESVTPRPADGPASANDVAWIARHRVQPTQPVDGGELVRRMRDDDRY